MNKIENKFNLGDIFTKISPIVVEFMGKEFEHYPPFKIIGIKATDTRSIEYYDFKDTISLIHFYYLLTDKDGSIVDWKNEFFIEECLKKI